MYLALDRGWPRFPQPLRGPWYSGIRLGSLRFQIRDFHPLWLSIPRYSSICNWSCYRGPYNPPINRGLGCSDFARRYWRNLIRFLFLRLLRCFSSPGTPPVSTFLQSRIFLTDYHVNVMGFPIRKPPDHWIMAPTRRVSPPYASFLGMNALGIHYQLEFIAEYKGPITCLKSKNRCSLSYNGKIKMQ